MTDSKPQLTLEHLKFIKDGVAFTQKEEANIYKEAGLIPYDRLFEICDAGFGWSYLFECPLKETSIIYFCALGLIPVLQERQKQGVEVNQAIMDITSNADAHTDTLFNGACAGLGDNPTIEQIRSIRFGLGNLYGLNDIFALNYAMLAHVAALRKFGKDMYQLCEDVRNGNDESFFQALRIDPTVLSCAPFIKRMSLAIMQGDHEFIRLVGNALKVKWKKQKVDLDFLRVILNALADSGQLDDLSQNDADDLFIQKLQVYSNNGEDPARSLYRFIQRYKNSY